MSRLSNIVLHPSPELEEFDTGLRYTDILFGFVIRELFIRLQHVAQLDAQAQLQLVLGAILVLGSWIGYRQSLYRSKYQLRFFNLPLLRFVVDQAMLVLYFRIATIIPLKDDPVRYVTEEVVADTAQLIMYVFVLYLLWDAIGIWIDCAGARNSDGTKVPRYPKTMKNALGKYEKTTEWQSPNWGGLWITAAALILVASIWLLTYPWWITLPSLGIILLAYRWVKEVKNSWILLSKS